MKIEKRLIAFVFLSLVFISFFSFSVVSAGWFGDFFNKIFNRGNLITGEVTYQIGNRYLFNTVLGAGGRYYHVVAFQNSSVPVCPELLGIVSPNGYSCLYETVDLRNIGQGIETGSFIYKDVTDCGGSYYFNQDLDIVLPWTPTASYFCFGNLEMNIVYNPGDACGTLYSFKQARDCASLGGTCSSSTGRCINLCTPTTCSAQGKNCGSISDGCGGTLNCGSCTSPNTCTNNVCGCTPSTTSFTPALNTFCETKTVKNSCNQNVQKTGTLVCGAGYGCISNACVNVTGACNLPWSGLIAHGQNVTAYSSLVVSQGSSCVSQTRTCNNGVLTGSYNYSSCCAPSATDFSPALDSFCGNMTVNNSCNQSVQMSGTLNCGEGIDCINNFCMSYTWIPSDWSNCTGGNCSGGGIQFRNVTCQLNGTIVNDSYCNDTKLDLNQSCKLSCPRGKVCSNGVCITWSGTGSNPGGSSTSTSSSSTSNSGDSSQGSQTSNVTEIKDDASFYIVLVIILIVAVAILAVIYFVIFRTPPKKPSSKDSSSASKGNGPPPASPTGQLQNPPQMKAPSPVPQNVMNNSLPQNRIPVQGLPPRR